MKMTDILEKDKDRLLTEMTAAGSAEKAVGILEKESDKILLTYNERCDSDAERDAAAHLMQAVRLSLHLIDTTGKTKVWESGAAKEGSGKISAGVILMLVGGLVLCAFGLIPIVMYCAQHVNGSARTDLIIRCAATFIGIATLFMAGSSYGRPKDKTNKEYHVEIHPDANRIYRDFRTMIISVDQSLEEVRAAEAQSKKDLAGTIDGRKATTPELELFSDLLAASYSGDPEYALEKIDAIKYYLHTQQIEVVDYSDETQNFFDLMPGNRYGTIRPALVADGMLLKKGLASKGR